MGLLGDLVVKIVGDTADFVRKIDQSGRKMSQFDRDMKKIAQSLVKTGRALTLGVTLPILGIAAAAVKSAADLELQQAAFETMLGSAEKAKTLLQDLTDLAAKTPFQLPDLAEGTKTLLAFGIELDDVLPTLQMLGDISLGDSERLKQLALVFGQITSAGRLMGQDLLQLINVGFNPLQAISEKTGETMADLKDRMSQGAISAEEVTEAFRSATSEGGLFFGGMERASQTLAGVLSTLKDNVGILARSFANLLLPALKNIVTQATELIQRWNEIDDGTRRMILQYAGMAAAIGPLVLAIGFGIKAFLAIKTAVIALNIAMAANPAILVTAAIAGLVAGIVIALPFLVRMITRQRDYRDVTNQTAEAIEALTQIERAATRAKAIELREREVGIIRELNAQIRRYTDEIGNANAEITNAQIILADLNDERDAAIEKQDALSTQITLLDRATRDYNLALEDAAAETDVLSDAEAAAAAEAAALQAALDALTDELEDNADAVVEWTSGWRGAAQTAQEELTLGFFDPWRQAREKALEEHEELLVEWTSGWRDAAQASQDELLLGFFNPVEESVEEVTGEWLSGWRDAAQASQDELLLGFFEPVKEAQEDLQTQLEKFLDWYQDNYIDKIVDMAQGLGSALIDFANARANADIAAIERSGLAEEERDRQIRVIQRDQAQRAKRLALFNAVIDTAQAVIGMLVDPGSVAGVVLAVLAGITGAASIAAIAAQPLPALAEGGIVTGPTPVVVGEGGQPEIIFPLDQLENFLASRGDFSDTGGGDMHVIVNLDGQPILDTVTKATRDGRVQIHARAVV